MKKIRLTESQLIDLIKKSVNKVKNINENQIINEIEYVNPTYLAQVAKALVKDMNVFDVTVQNLQNAYANISKMKNYVWQDDGTCAIDKLLAYYKSYKGGSGFQEDLKAAKESNDPEFDDLKVRIEKLITTLQKSCATAKNERDTALSACASKEPGFRDVGNGAWAILPFGKGWINGYNDGRATADKNNVWYSYVDKKTNTNKQTQGTKGTCVNGVLNLDAWVKI
jgi:hypothetical protein